MKKISFLTIIALFFVFSVVFIVTEIKAGSEHNVYSWAWSNNIGWISFNSTNCDPDGDGLSDGITDCPSVGTPIANYGVNIAQPSGEFSGYTWSSGIGWITFNRANTGPPPAAPDYGTHLAQVDLTNCPDNKCPVSGWARVYSAIGDSTNWPNGGWIKLRGPTYEVSIDMSKNPAEFEGWAWEWDVIGWLSFNCKNRGSCETVDYKVLVSLGPDDSLVCDADGPYSGVEGQPITLDGSGSSDLDGTIESYSWTCTGGTLTNPDTVQPTFTGSVGSSYTCTLTVTNDGGASASCDATVTIIDLPLAVVLSADPYFGLVPLEDVDLEASVLTPGTELIDYYFWCDCGYGGTDPVQCGTPALQVDGHPENFYNAVDICDYETKGIFTTKVIVQRDGKWAQAQATVSTILSLPDWIEIIPF